MLRTFNMGAGLIVVAAPHATDAITAHLTGQGYDSAIIGTIVAREQAGDEAVAFTGALRWGSRQ